MSQKAIKVWTLVAERKGKWFSQVRILTEDTSYQPKKMKDYHRRPY